MAVEVLDYQGCLKLRREGDAGEAASATLQSMQALVTLLAQKQKQEQEGEAQKEDCSNTTDATIYEFKKLISALGGSGHARFRRAPGGSPASPPSRAQGLNLPQLQDKVRHSTSLHDAMQRARTSDIFAHDAHVSQHNSSCSPCNNEEKVGGCACNANTHHANTHIKPLFEDQSPHISHVYGHARCRDSAATHKLCHQAPAIRLPAVPQAQQNMLPQLRLSHTSQIVSRPCSEVDQDTFVPTTLTNSSFVSSVSMEGGGTVSNGKPLFSSGRPPLPPKKRKAPEEIEERKRSCHKSGQCHCAAKRRKSRSGTILRVSATGLKNTDIPADGFSWCKYEEKPIKGCLESRVYYKCTSVRGCPAKKHVQRALDDPNMLIVTYGREHRHPQIHKVMTRE